MRREIDRRCRLVTSMLNARDLHMPSSLRGGFGPGPKMSSFGIPPKTEGLLWALKPLFSAREGPSSIPGSVLMELHRTPDEHKKRNACMGNAGVGVGVFGACNMCIMLDPYIRVSPRACPPHAWLAQRTHRTRAWRLQRAHCIVAAA